VPGVLEQPVIRCPDPVHAGDHEQGCFWTF
jgi:hypothetical protein